VDPTSRAPRAIDVFYGGRDDNMRATKDNLSSDALYKRLQVVMKIPREVNSHVCGHDIYLAILLPSSMPSSLRLATDDW
jgi:hypothetical protein